MNLLRDGHVAVCRVTDCQGHWHFHGCAFESRSWQKSLAIHASPNRKKISTSEIERSQHHRWKPEFLVSDWRNSGKPDRWQRINLLIWMFLTIISATHRKYCTRYLDLTSVCMIKARKLGLLTYALRNSENATQMVQEWMVSVYRIYC